MEEAFEVVPEEATVEVDQQVTKYRVNAAQQTVEPYQETEKVTQTVLTGLTVNRVRPDLRFDENTGKFYRKRTVEDVELDSTLIEQIESYDLPDYIKQRLPETTASN